MILSRIIGRTRTHVSSLGFGGASIGNLYHAVDDSTAAAAVDEAWSQGIRYFDTAPHYGLGLSETRLGAALRAYPRDQYTISTKVGRLLVGNDAPVGSDLASGGFDVPDHLTRRFDFTERGVLESLESSLLRTGLDRFDIVYVHDPDDHVEAAIAHAIPALISLREQGVVGAVGVGMNSAVPLRTFVERCDIDVVMVAGRWTLLDRSAQQLLDDCGRRHVSAVAAAPFNSGLLSTSRPDASLHFDYDSPSRTVVQTAQRLASWCAEAGTELPHAALQFPLRHPAVASVVVGMRTPAHVAANARWLTTPVPDRAWSQLDRPATAPGENPQREDD